MSSSHPLRIAVASLPPEGLPWSGEVTAAALGVPEDDRIRFALPIRFTLRVSPVETEVLIEGQLRARLRCGCDRCLVTFETEVGTDEVCHLLALPEDGVIDLTENVREDMLLTLPSRCLCREDCRGLCPQCGLDLNTGSCDCTAKRLSSDAWSALDGVRPASRPRK